MNFNNFRNSLEKHFRNSYGFDNFSRYLVAAGLLLSISRWTSPLALILIGYAAWRSFSKDIYKRQKEARIFEGYLYSLKQRFSGTGAALKDSFRYKIFTCPNCSQKLRVPRKKGRLLISCKKCGTEFKGKS